MNTILSFPILGTAVFTCVSFVCTIVSVHAGTLPSHSSPKAKAANSTAAKIKPVESAKATKSSNIRYIEKREKGLFITIDDDGTEYVIDNYNHLAMVRKDGIVLASQTLDTPRPDKELTAVRAEIAHELSDKQ